IQLTRANSATAVLELLERYDLSLYRAANTALVREFTITCTQKGNALLRAELASPMSLAWGNEANTVGDSTFNLNLSGLNLADWKAFLGENPPNGNVSVRSEEHTSE